MKTFNVRVASVEPGIIATSMADRIENPAASLYGQSARFVALYANAAKVLEVAESGSWQLRHPVGPDAVPFLQWRSQMMDEDWVEMNAEDDATFFSRLSELNKN
jgi:hypothetical protein